MRIRVHLPSNKGRGDPPLQVLVELNPHGGGEVCPDCGQDYVRENGGVRRKRFDELRPDLFLSDWRKVKKIEAMQELRNLKSEFSGTSQLIKGRQERT